MTFAVPPITPAAAAGTPPERYTDHPAALAIVTAIFFMWGFLTALNDILIPHLKAVFELDYTRAMLVQFTFFGAYFLMSLPAGRVVSRLGYKQGIVLGLGIAGLGAAAFWPAAQLRNYGLFLGALFVLASGITVLQVAANPYVALLGPARTSSSRLTLAQALNSLGTTLAPIFGGLLILAGAVMGAKQLAIQPAAVQVAYRVYEAQSVQGPYLGLALVLFALALMVWWLHLPPLTEATERADHQRHTLRGALRHRHVRFGVLAIFFYVGAEVSIGSFLVNYLSLPQIGSMTEQHAAHYVALYWGGAMVGRLAGSALLAWLNPRKLLAIFAALAAALLLTSMLTGGNVAMASVIAIGLFNSIMFPTIFSLGIEGLGPLTGKASSLLIMAIVGGALVPLAQGFLADHIGIQHAFVLPLMCYAFIVYYGLRGSLIFSPRAAVDVR